MDLTHWGLEKPPFPSGLDRKLFYEGASHREALARLRFLLAHQRRLGLVLGDPGVGKSLLLEVFAEECRRAGHAVAQVAMRGLTTREFYWQLGCALQAAVRVEDDTVRLFRQVNDRLQECRWQDQRTVVFLDDLDQAGPDLRSQLLRLSRLEAAEQGWLTLVTSVRPERLGRVGEALLELVDLRIDLQPWDELDTVGYLQMALLEAGAERPLFDEEATTSVQQLAGGVPRSINRLADLALVAGAAEGLTTVSAAIVEAVHESMNPLSPVS